MSKSLGNLVFVSKLISQGVNPMAIRWALMGHHYSSDLMWTNEILERATYDVDQLQLMLAREDVAPTDKVIDSIISALSHNLDTPEVLKSLRAWISDTKDGATGGSAGELSRAIDTLLGIAL